MAEGFFPTRISRVTRIFHHHAKGSFSQGDTGTKLKYSFNRELLGLGELNLDTFFSINNKGVST